MQKHRRIIDQLHSEIGIRINGSNRWDIQVRDDRFYPRVLKDGSLGLGESYMEGWWDCSHIDEFICRILKGKLEEKIRQNLKTLLFYLSARIFNLQSPSRAGIITRKHYDLGNDLFFSFLDPHNMVTAVNISDEQIRFAQESCKDLPVTVLKEDYRKIRGSFDKIVSIGMFEHVGRKNYADFMGVVNRCLKDKGVFLLHTIGSNASHFSGDPWISRYIPPNGMLPSIAQISKVAENRFVIEDVHNLAPHYNKTLKLWNDRFQSAWSGLCGSYDGVFKRM